MSALNVVTRSASQKTPSSKRRGGGGKPRPKFRIIERELSFTDPSQACEQLRDAIMNLMEETGQLGNRTFRCNRRCQRVQQVLSKLLGDAEIHLGDVALRQSAKKPFHEIPIVVIDAPALNCPPARGGKVSNKSWFAQALTNPNTHIRIAAFNYDRN